ncbi:hypothetical protein KC19_11G029900 [Ceratodon purpureus]|uniref:Uncharacterized protein n=1 Tax=Ceratodon purpureus TaxID=3225 RepID=A0A8T0GDI5_CERPU|nr:hypothetical protein KC19_11G029900 [Ceratodon purpureus]
MSHIDYNEDNPGPGTYWLNYKHVLPQAPIQSIAHHLPIWFDYGKPGPGTYNLRKDGNDSPKYTIAEKNRWFPWSGVPGPGTYFLLDHIKHTNIRVPAYTIADKNKWFPWNGVPGPGTYNLREELPANDDMGYTIGRRFTTKGSPTPGPGAYSPQSPSGSPKYTMAQHVNDASRATTPGVGAYNLRSQEFAGPRYTMGRRFYRLRDMKRERRYSRALKHRPKPARSSSPARAGPQTSPDKVHRKCSTDVHAKPQVPRRASSRFVSPPRTSAIGIQVELPTPGVPPTPAPPPAEPVVPKSNAWMDVGKRLQHTRDAITAAANLPDPEPPPPPASASAEAPPEA